MRGKIQQPNYAFDSLMINGIVDSTNATQARAPNGSNGNSLDCWRYYPPAGAKVFHMRIQMGANTKDNDTLFYLEKNGTKVAASEVTYEAAETGLKELDLEIDLATTDYINIVRDSVLSTTGSITYMLQADVRF